MASEIETASESEEVISLPKVSETETESEVLFVTSIVVTSDRATLSVRPRTL